MIGWRVSSSLRTDVVLDALEQAIYARSRDTLTGLRRLLGPIGDMPPAEYEAQYDAQAAVA